MVWKLYNQKQHQTIDSWNLENQEIDLYAMYGDTLSISADWYHSHPLNMSNIKDYIFVIEEENQIIGFIISNVYQNEDNKIAASINPIVVNPRLLNQGYARKIMIEFVEKKDQLLHINIDFLRAMVSRKNTKSINLFEHLGFQRIKEEDGFFEYQLHLGGKKNA